MWHNHPSYRLGWRFHTWMHFTQRASFWVLINSGLVTPYGNSSLGQYWLRSFQWHHNEYHGVSNHRRLYCLFNCLFRLTSKKTSKPVLLVLGGESIGDWWPVPSQRASNAETVSFLWRHQVLSWCRWHQSVTWTNSDLFLICVKTVEQTMELLVISDAIISIWYHCNGVHYSYSVQEATRWINNITLWHLP